MAVAVHETIDGVVVRVWNAGENDRYLSVLTAEKGRITILAKGSCSVRSQQLSVSQLYTYGNFEFYRRGIRYILKDGTAYQPFYGLTTDMDRVDLAAYLCELTCELTDEGEAAGEMLRLLLNALHAIAYGIRPLEQVKGTFELRAAMLSGYAPDLSGCSLCGRPHAETFYLDVMNGALLCSDCFGGRQKQPRPVSADYADELREAEIVSVLSAAVTAAVRYCAVAPLERILSFELKEAADLNAFAAVAETYILSHIGHGFEALDFYHTMRRQKQT